MSHALRALFEGLWMVLRAPILLAGVTILTLAAAVPFGIVLGTRVQAELSNQQPIALESVEIDPEWWLELRHRARGLEATFTPTVIGFAAPLDNLSALLDGTPRPIVLAAPVVIYGLLWAFLWGGILERFAGGRRTSIRQFATAGLRHLPRFAGISAAAAVVHLLLFLTVHALLFGPVYEWLSSHAATERDAFFWRVALYIVFGSLLVSVSLVVDYARISLVTGGARTMREGVGMAARFVRDRASAVVPLYLLTGLLFVALLALYGTAETLGGVRLGGWRAVLVGQGYIIGRLAIRLTFAASEVRLFQSLRAGR